MSQSSSRGFTFIELMIVVGIIGVLAAIAGPAYQDYTARGKVAEAFDLAKPVQKNIRDYYDRWGVFPTSNGQTGLQAAERYAGHYVKSIQVEQGGVISITLDDITKEINGQELHLIPAVNVASPTAPFAWVCEKAPPPEGMKPTAPISEERLTLPSKYLPASCRKSRS